MSAIRSFVYVLGMKHTHPTNDTQGGAVNELIYSTHPNSDAFVAECKMP